MHMVSLQSWEMSPWPVKRNNLRNNPCNHRFGCFDTQTILINITEVLRMKKQDSKSANYSTVIAIIVFLALIVGNYFQYQLTPLAGQLMKDFNITQSQFSSIFTSPMIASIILGIVAGVLADKFGIKKVIAVALLIAAVGLCIRPFANSYGPLFASMILGGLGITFLNANLSKIIGGWYTPQQVGTIMGIIMAGNTVGQTLGTATTAMLPSMTTAFWISGIAAVLVAVLWIAFVREGPYGKREEGSPKVPLSQSLKTVLKSKNVWLVGICLAFLLGCNVALTSFLPTALQSRGYTEAAAGLVSSVMTIGSFCGTFIGPIILTKLPRMKPALVVCAIVAALCAAFGWNAPTPLVPVILFIAGAFISALVPTFMSFPMLLPEIGPAYAGSAGGIMTTLELLGAVIIPTYIITPMAGSNFSLYFIMAAVSALLMVLSAIFLPELNRKKQAVEIV